MESEDHYLHLPPELRQIMLFSLKAPNFGGAASGHLYSMSPPPPTATPLPLPPPPPTIAGVVCSSQRRWPREETLTLLEVRGRLDPKFREAAQKAPLWDEVARIMAEEYGYQRTGRKCREKLDNLYKYYKKTKEGKIGKQEGKHYRFFRQLEALYAPSTTTTNKNPNFNEKQSTLIFSTSSDSSNEEEEEEETLLAKRWITELIEAQMKRLLEMQEVWFEKMMRSFERMEEGRLRREESWRREEAVREERERRRTASERAWGEAREASMMAAMEKIMRQRESFGAAMAGWGGEESGEMECELSRVMGVL